MLLLYSGILETSVLVMPMMQRRAVDMIKVMEASL